MKIADKQEMTCPCGEAADPDMVEGFRMGFVKTPPLCSTCQTEADAGEQRRRLAQAQKREGIEKEARLSVIPPEMRRTDTGFAGFNVGLWLRLESWEPSGKWIGIVGNAGACKTRCLALLAQKLIDAGHSVTWTTACEFQDRAEDTYSGDRELKKEAHRYFRACKKAAILVLDDLGKNTWSPTVERHLFSVIDHRKTHDLPVLWTANTHPMQLLDKLSADRAGPLIGRLTEASTIIKTR